MKGIRKAVLAINNARTIAIAGHINPDGDAIGSLLSLGGGLKQLGKKVYMVSQDGVPKKYRHLPGAKDVQKTLKETVDLAITVDCNCRAMLGRIFPSLSRAKTLLEIDHHDIRQPFGDICLEDHEAAAVGEQIYILLRQLGATITREIAQNILTSIIVETNSFKLPNARPFTFQVCAELMRTGVDFYRLVDMVFWSNTKEVALLSGLCMSRCKFEENGKLVWSHMKQVDYDKVNGKDEDVDAAPDLMRAITGVDIAVLFREKSPKKLRVSLRSKNEINVAQVAEIYRGGGHTDNAGCVIPNSPKVMKELLAAARKLI